MAVDQIQVVKQLFTYINSVAFTPDERTRNDNFKNLLILANPGLFLGTVNEADNNQLYVQSNALDVNLNASFVYRLKAEKVSRVWQDIINNETHPNANDPNTEIQKALLEAYLKEHRKKYYELLLAFLGAEADWQNMQATNPGDPKGPVIQAKRDAASQDFQDVAIDYEKNLNALQVLKDNDPNKFWADAGAAIDKNWRPNAKAPKGRFYPAFLEPPVSAWATGGGFTACHFDSTDNQWNSFSSSTSWSGGISVSWGLFSFGASASESHQTTSSDHEFNKTVIDFELMRVRVNRDSWFDPALITTRSWKWKNNQANPLCDGANPPDGLMPLIVTEVLVARNVKIVGDFSKETASWTRDQVTAGGSIGFGPFSIGGSYSSDVQTARKTTVGEDGSISAPDPQIIGFFASVLPNVPNPDPNIKGW